jgi:hypothetical protein
VDRCIPDAVIGRLQYGKGRTTLFKRWQGIQRADA